MITFCFFNNDEAAYLTRRFDVHDGKKSQQEDFEEFGRRIGLGDKLIKREIDGFIHEKPLVQALIDRSFLSEELKKQYRLSMSYRCKMLSLQ
mgnify:CR=1 FL=1